VRATFDDVAMAIDAFIAQCAPGPLILYMHDIGGPIGMRIATAHPERIAGLIFQNMTTSVEGWNPERLKVYERLSGPETPENLAEAEQFTTVDRDMFLHKRGARQPDALNPDAWAIDAYAFSIAANRVFMSRLFMNLATNIQHYPEWNAYLKDRQPKTRIVWGRNDPLFVPAAAEFVKQVVPSAELRYSTAATSCLTSTPTRSPRRSSRCCPDRADARRGLRRLSLAGAFPCRIKSLSSVPWYRAIADPSG
jgi:pimeloyl-ACP methyl ester carboxylesterase